MFVKFNKARHAE